jgi:hypothetical protein
MTDYVDLAKRLRAAGVIYTPDQIHEALERAAPTIEESAWLAKVKGFGDATESARRYATILRWLAENIEELMRDAERGRAMKSATFSPGDHDEDRS